jgi:hypothetical protein
MVEEMNNVLVVEIDKAFNVDPRCYFPTAYLYQPSSVTGSNRMLTLSLPTTPAIKTSSYSPPQRQHRAEESDAVYGPSATLQLSSINAT